MDNSTLPPAPAEEEARDACCGVCSSMFHSTSDHPPTLAGVASFAAVGAVTEEFPPGYDPAEADRLIGRDVPPDVSSVGPADQPVRDFNANSVHGDVPSDGPPAQ